MSSSAALFALVSILLVIAPIAGFLAYVVVRYAPIVVRVFEENPMFLPLRVSPVEEGEEVRFRTRDGLGLVGTYLKARTPRRSGVMVFCHEYLSDRWSALPYADHLRDLGFDLFSFDFRNHGRSESDPAYNPLQWVTDHEVADLDAALAYLRNRPDADRAGVGLFGISRGGGTALCVASRDPRVWGVISDGAFPTRGTMSSYIIRWAKIYVSNKFLWKMVPMAVYEFVAWDARRRTQAKLNCRYAKVEQAVARLAPRPWLSIHGAKDAYIGVDIAKGLFNRAGEPKELWIVEGAKHNRCREQNNAAYQARVASFVGRYAPRGHQEPTQDDKAKVVGPSVVLHELPIATDLGVVVPG